MSLIHQTTKHIRSCLFPIIGETTVKTFFSYYAIFSSGVMLGLYKQGKFYLRISHRLLERYSWAATLTRLEDSRTGIYDKHFYYIPDHLFDPLIHTPDFLNEIVQEITETKRQQVNSRKKLIRSLPNLNINIERLLRRLGILSIEELDAKGEIAIFVELVRMGVEVNKSLLFKLYGAIRRQYIYTLSNQQKSAILAELNQALYDAGLRQRF